MQVERRLVPDIAAHLVAGGENAGRAHGFAPRGSQVITDGYIRASKAQTAVSVSHARVVR